jgi:hypothetical protein
MRHAGKIARLPEQIREHINSRLQDGEEGRQLWRLRAFAFARKVGLNCSTEFKVIQSVSK